MPLSRLRSMKLFSSSRIGDADVEVAVGREDDAVDGVLVEAGFGQAIGVCDARRAGRRTARAEAFDGGQDLALVGDLVGSSATPEPEA